MALIAMVSMLLFASMVFFVRDRGYLFKGDGLYYYVYAHSMFYDHDLDFTNEFQYFLGTGDSASDQRTRLVGRPKNKYPVGTALLIGPFYGSVSAILGPWFFDGKSMEDFPWLLDQSIFSFGGILIGLLGLWLSYLFVTYHFPKKDSLIATICLWACSPLLYYFIREPFVSHLPVLFCTALFLTLWKTPSLSLHLRAFFMCVAGALTVITRPQDVLILLVPAVVFLLGGFKIRQNSGKRLALTIMLCFSGFAGIFLIQMATWHSLYGDYLVNTYLEGGERFLYYKSPYIFSVLFSSNHGLISWHPLIALCLAGLLFTPKSLQHIAWAFLVWFAVQLYVTASWYGWSMGFSFGNRAFISLTPMFIFGLASFYGWLKRPWAKRLFFSAVGLLFVWNVTLILAYLSEMIPYNRTFSWWELIRQVPDLHRSIFAKIATL